MSFLNDLNIVQREAVKAVEGPVMIVAGAGSGKTRVLTYRVAYLLSIGVPAYQILALTFTNRAAEEMKKRIISLVGDKSSHLWMGTFHSMFARLLRQECDVIGYNRNFTIYDTEDSLKLIKDILLSLNLSIQQLKPRIIQALISKAKNKLIYPDQYSNIAKDIFEENTAIIYKEYQERLKKNNAMDFDDLLLKPIEIFEKHKKILSKYQDRFKFILVDEYQDTNRAQYKLINLLAQKYQNVCVVGDDSQSIYRFRGADIQNILDFEKDFPNCKLFRLEQNYRSTQSILSAADQLIKNNINRIDKNLWTENEKGDKISVLVCLDDKDEGAKVVSYIKNEIFSRKLEFKNFAVLYRTNAQSRSIEDSLRRNGIPYVIIGGLEFYKRKEIKDVLAYLKLIINPKDNVSFKRIINYPSRGIGEVTLNILEQFSHKNKLSLFEAIEKINEDDKFSEKAVQRLRSFHTFIKKYQMLIPELSASELSRSLVDEIEILKEFKEEGSLDSLSRWENVQELLSAITEFSEEKENGSLEAFLQEVSLVSDVDRWDNSSNAITLMTLHSAKGLEFDVVFITGLEEGLLPFYSSLVEMNELEEERRLFYVGITRAMKKLYLSYAQRRFRFSDATFPIPSKFLNEISDHYLEYEENIPVQSYEKKESSSLFTNTKSHKKISHLKGDIEEKYFYQNFHDYENESQININLKIGTVVEHDIFGKGKIITLSGSGENTKAVVDFSNVGRKNLLLKYAPMRILR